MKSVLQFEKECFICGTPMNLEEHHVFMGTSNRKQSEKHGFKVWLCHEHHTGNSGVHFNKELDLELKKLAQTYFEGHLGSRDDFRAEFGKSWL